MRIVSLRLKHYPPDEEMILGIKNGVKKSSEELYYKYKNDCINYILKKFGQSIDLNDALDVYQESSGIFHQNIINGKFELRSNAKIKSYLIGVCDRQAKKYIATAPRESPLNDEVDVPVEASEDDERLTIILEELKKMHEKCFRLLYKYFFLHKTMVNIAAELNYSNADTAKARKYMCEKYLKKAVISRIAL